MQLQLGPHHAPPCMQPRGPLLCQPACALRHVSAAAGMRGPRDVLPGQGSMGRGRGGRSAQPPPEPERRPRGDPWGPEQPPAGRMQDEDPEDFDDDLDEGFRRRQRGDDRWEQYPGRGRGGRGGSARGGRAQGRGGPGGGPPAPPRGLSRTQRQLFTSLEQLRQEEEEGRGRAAAAAAPPSVIIGRGEGRASRGGSGGGDGSRSFSSGVGGRELAPAAAGPGRGLSGPRGSRPASRRAPDPDDFVVVRPADIFQEPASAAALKAAAANEELDGTRFWKAAGFQQEAAEEGEDDDDGEEGEGEEEDEDAMFGDEDEGEESEPAAETAPETEDEQALRSLYTTPGKLPGRYIHPDLKVQGRGRGWVATAALQPGTLAFVSVPLGIVYCDEGQQPEPEELADLMLLRSRLTAAQAEVLTRLHPGAGASTSASLQPSAATAPASTPDAASTSAPSEPTSAAASSSSAAARSRRASPTSRSALVPLAALPDCVAKLEAAAAAGPAKPLELGSDELCRLVAANCLGEAGQDTSLCVLRGEDSVGYLGLWPEAALLAHSCAPNAVAVAVGPQLVVRVAEELDAGAELTINWLGEGLTAPLAQRREQLSKAFGFTCECRRCKAEASSLSSSPALQQALVSTHARCQAMSPRLEEAIEKEDLAEVDGMRVELEGMRERLEEEMRAARCSSKARAWLQASVFDLYDMLSLAADEEPPSPSPTSSSWRGGDRGGRGSARGSGGGGRGRGGQSQQGAVLDTERLAWCVRILGQTAKGGDAHVDLAAELMGRTASRFGDGHQEAKDAAAACKEAFKARYGPVSQALFEELALARLLDE